MIENQQAAVKYYKNDFPAEDELVMVECTSCEESGCYVELLEYENKKGMVPLNEYSHSMKKSIQRAMKVGKVEAVRVIRVDTSKGYIDLSKSKVKVEDENAAKDKYAKAKAIHSILIHVAEVCKVDIESLYKQIVWPLYESPIHPLDAFKMVMTKEEKINDFKIENPEVKNALLEEIKRRFKRPVFKTMAVFKVSIKVFDAIGTLKKILKMGVEASTSQGYDVKITILGAPDYLAEVSTASKEDGEKAIMIALDAIESESKKIDPHSEFDIKKKPKVVGDSSAQIHEIYAAEEEALEKEDADLEQVCEDEDD